MNIDTKSKLLDLAYSVSLLLEFFPTPKEQRDYFLKEPSPYSSGVMEKLRVQDILNNVYMLAKRSERLVEETKANDCKGVVNFLLVGDDVIEYFIKEGWEIVSAAPNPHPCPYIYFSIRKDFDHSLTTGERREMLDLAYKYLRKL